MPNSIQLFFAKAIPLPFIGPASSNQESTDKRKSIAKFLTRTLLLLDDPRISKNVQSGINENPQEHIYDVLFNLGLGKADANSTNASLGYNAEWLGPGADQDKELRRMVSLLGTVTARSLSGLEVAIPPQDGRHQFFAPLRKIMNSIFLSGADNTPVHQRQKELFGSLDLDKNNADHREFADFIGLPTDELRDHVKKSFEDFRAQSVSADGIMSLFPEKSVLDPSAATPTSKSTATHLFPEKLTGNTLTKSKVNDEEWWAPRMKATQAAHSQILGMYLASNARSLAGKGAPWFANQGEFDRFAWSMMQHTNMLGTLFANTGEISPPKMQEEIVKASIPHATKMINAIQGLRPNGLVKVQAEQPWFKKEHRTWDGSCSLAHEATTGSLEDSPSHWDIDEV